MKYCLFVGFLCLLTHVEILLAGRLLVGLSYLVNWSVIVIYLSCNLMDTNCLLEGMAASVNHYMTGVLSVCGIY